MEEMVTAVAVAVETVDKAVMVATEAGMGELEVMVERVVTQVAQGIVVALAVERGEKS